MVKKTRFIWYWWKVSIDQPYPYIGLEGNLEGNDTSI